jgi:FkbM family methyltransferase
VLSHRILAENASLSEVEKLRSIARQLLKKIPGVAQLASRVRVLLDRASYTLKGEPYVETEPLSMAELARLISKEDPVILEIGCNDGSDTKRLRATFPDAFIHCFEPDERARKRFLANGGMETCTSMHPCAIGASDGHTTFYVSSGRETSEMPEGWDLSGSIRKPVNHLKAVPWVKFDQKTEVEVITLDSFFEKENVSLVDFIWMDVQGAELDVIRGGSAALRAVRYLYTEYDNDGLYDGGATLAEICRHLPGFVLLKRYHDDALFVNRSLGDSYPRKNEKWSSPGSWKRS